MNTVKNIFPVSQKFSLCYKQKFPVFSLSGKSKNQIPCFPCAVATLVERKENVYSSHRILIVVTR